MSQEQKELTAIQKAIKLGAQKKGGRYYVTDPKKVREVYAALQKSGMEVLYSMKEEFGRFTCAFTLRPYVMPAEVSYDAMRERAIRYERPKRAECRY